MALSSFAPIFRFRAQQFTDASTNLPTPNIFSGGHAPETR